MAKEIKRNTWSKFVKKFTEDNRYRWMSVTVSDKKSENGGEYYETPFMGLALEKKGRLIDGLQLISGSDDPDRLKNPLISLKQPEKVVVEKTKNGEDVQLKIKTKDGREAAVKLSGPPDPYPLVERVAYNIYQKRGYSHGDDQNDWYEAERRIRDTESQTV